MSTPPAKLFRLPRLRLRLGLLLHILIALALVILVNQLATRRPWVKDLTATQDLTLSERTVNVLRHLDRQVRVVVAVRRGHPLYQRVYDLAAAADAIANERINLDTIDPIREPAEATRLIGRINASVEQRSRDEDGQGGAGLPPFTLEGDQLLIISGDYDVVERIPVDDMVLEESLPQGGTTRLFRGEQLFTAALLAATQPEPDVVGLVTGLGEPPNGPRGPEMIAAALPWQNAQLQFLDLETATEIPARVRALVFYGPQVDLSEHAAQLVLDYWKAERGGLLYLLQPGHSASQPRLLAIPRAHGILPQDNRVLRLLPGGLGAEARVDATITAPLAVTAPWSPEWRKLLQSSPNLSPGEQIDRATALVGKPSQIAVTLPPLSSSLRTDEALLRQSQGRALLTELLQSPDAYWGETDRQQDPPTLDPARDDVGPLTLAAAVDLDPQARAKGNRTSRLVVVGNASLLGNETSPQSNFDFVLNALSWVMAREELTGIAPKRPELFAFKLDETARDRLQLVYLGLFPATLLAIALLVQQARRR